MVHCPQLQTCAVSERYTLWDLALTSLEVAHFPQIFTPRSPVPVMCCVQAEKLNIKQQREKEAVVLRQTRFHTSFVVVLFGHHERAAW